MKRYILMILGILVIVAMTWYGLSRPVYQACFDGYMPGISVNGELVPLSKGQTVDTSKTPMVAIYGTYCTDVK